MTGRGAEQMVNNWVQRRGSDRDVERRTRQIKEIVRLSTQMRADMDLETILTQAVEGIRSTLGFKVAVLNLIYPRSDYVEIGATTGLSDVERQRLIKSPPPVARLRAVLRPEFCVGHSYFIGHQYKHLLDGIEGVTLSGPLTSQRAPDAWHAEDVFFVPLKSPRDDELIGILSLDQPEDGKVPSLETIEIIELFASQAALAIDTSLLFRAREQERKAIEVELFELLYHLEQMRQGNLEVRVELSGDTLKPMADSLNAVVASLDDLLSDVQGAGIEVSANATAVRDEAALLASNAEYQAQRIFSAARAVEQMAASVRAIAEIAQQTTSTAREALDIAREGRAAAERAVEGMNAAREMALQSVKKMKRLGESTQDIGEIVQMVGDFAAQTNLLALNAAIEAARAGENGRGFAIVATEIRNLANSSAEATKHIQTRIKGMQTETGSVVATIDYSTQQIVLQSELATQAGAALEAVHDATQRIAHAIAQMSDTATRQADAAAAISHDMSAVAEGSTRTRDSMNQTRASMDRMVELARMLLRSIGAFHLAGSEQADWPALLPAAGPAAEQTTLPMPTLGASLGSLGMAAPPSVPLTRPLPAVGASLSPGSSIPGLPVLDPNASGTHASRPVQPVTSGPLAQRQTRGPLVPPQTSGPLPGPAATTSQSVLRAGAQTRVLPAVNPNTSDAGFDGTSSDGESR